MGKPSVGKSAASKTASRQAAGLRKHKRADRPVLVLAALGALLAGYLGYASWFSGILPFCGEESGCDLVQQSRWSHFAGLPIAFWGMLLYVALGWVAYRFRDPLNRWGWSLNLALVGLGMSLYLTAISLFVIRATCVYCLASLGLFLALVGVILWRYPRGVPGFTLWPWLGRASSMMVVVVLVFGLYKSDLLRGSEDPYLRELAIHLERGGAKFYGASWCPTCERQRDLFGVAKDRLPYIECSPGGRSAPRAPRCIQEGIRNYPTWIIEGTRSVGYLNAEELARRSGFRSAAP